jgi:hypothetical protein
MDMTNDRAFDDDARMRLWESGLYDLVQEYNASSPEIPPTEEERQQVKLVARLIRFARDYAGGLVSDDYLRREAFGVLVAIKTSAFIEGMDAGMELAREEGD